MKELIQVSTELILVYRVGLMKILMISPEE